jgi:hypothetical protein
VQSTNQKPLRASVVKKRFFCGQKKARIGVRAKDYHQREDGGNMKKHSIASNVLVYSNIFINLSSGLFAYSWSVKQFVLFFNGLNG